MSYDFIIENELPQWVISEIQLISQEHEVSFDEALEIYYDLEGGSDEN